MERLFGNLVDGLSKNKEMNNTSLLELAKRLNVPRRNCMKTREKLEDVIKDTINEYKEIIFGSDIPKCTTYLDKLWKQQKIDQYVHDRTLMDDTIRKLAWEGLQKNIVFDDETVIYKRTGEVLDPEVDSTYYKNKF